MEQGLRHGDALELAAAWGAPLRACGAVRLSERPLVAEVDRSRLYWLEISLQGALLTRNREAIHALEEALHVYHALASCAGFSAHLNGQFWTEVLSRAGVGGSAHDLASAVLDEDFPRFRLVFDVELPDAQQESALVEETLEQFLTQDNANRSCVFKESMEQLDPLIVCPTRRMRPVQLAVVLPSMDTRWLLPAMERLMVGRYEGKGGGDVQVQEISLNQRRHKPADPMDGTTWLEKLPQIPAVSDWIVDEYIEDARVFGKLYRRLLGLEDEIVMKIRTLRVDRPSLSDDQFAALCSALPSANTVSTLRIYKDADWDWNVLGSSHDWAWLSYAIFHKQVKRSTLRNLFLDGCGFRVEDASVVESVRLLGSAALPAHIGLALPHIVQDDGPEENLSLIKTQIKATAGATVWKLQHKLDEDSLLKPLFSVDQTLSAVVLETIGPLGPLQPVIIPGIGVGYIQQEDFAEVFSGTHVGETLLSSLTGFGARLDKWNYGTVAGLKSLLHTLGHSLTSLDICSHELLVANDVGHILASCPRLNSIAVNHNGTYWTERHTARRSQFPLLQSLRVSCSMIESYAIVCALSFVSKPAFPSLHELYFHIIKASSVFPCVAKALGAFLIENPTISELTMVKVRHPTRQETTVNPNLQSKTLSVMGLSSHDLAASFHPLNIQYADTLRRAFEPLLDTAANGRGLPNEVVSNIISFVGDARKRQVWIDLIPQGNDFIPEAKLEKAWSVGISELNAMPEYVNAPPSPGTQGSGHQLVGSFASLEERIAHLQWRKTCNEREIQGTLRLTKKLQERDEFLRIANQTGSKTKKLEWTQNVISDELHKPLPVTQKQLDQLEQQAHTLEKSQADATNRHMAQIKEIQSKLDEREAHLLRKKEFERKKKELFGGEMS